MTQPTTPDKRVNLPTHLRWVTLDDLRVPPEGRGQRDLKAYRVNKLMASGFNPDVMGYPEVSDEDGTFWLLDGQARVEALKQWLGDWKGQQVQCRVHTGLTVAERADLFLLLNEGTAVSPMPRFKNAVEAGRPDETDIDRIVRINGLVVSNDQSEISIGAIATLTKIYRRSGGPVLGRTVRIAHNAYGKSGLEGVVLDGLSLLCQRYNGELEESHAITKLSAAHAGVSGLLGNANKLRLSTGNQRADCVAAAAHEIINRGKGGKKLPPWWKP